jgi:hypothetical protein
MARVVTRSPWTRNSRVEYNKQGSPFRSPVSSERQHAAERMVLKRQAEIEALRQQQDRVEIQTARGQKVMAQRILALTNNMHSWLAYLDEGHPLQQRAVIDPRGL